jgi:hypothetical protein
MALQKNKQTDNFKPVVLSEFQAAVDSPSNEFPTSWPRIMDLPPRSAHADLGTMLHQLREQAEGHVQIFVARAHVGSWSMTSGISARSPAGCDSSPFPILRFYGERLAPGTERTEQRTR